MRSRKLDESVVEDVLSYPWSGAMFSDRLWQNKTGPSVPCPGNHHTRDHAGKERPDHVEGTVGPNGQSYKAAERLIRTETTYFHGESDKAAYEAAGVDEYEYVATLDSRTCEVCAALDGKHFKLKDAQAGVN